MLEKKLHHPPCFFSSSIAGKWVAIAAATTTTEGHAKEIDETLSLLNETDEHRPFNKSLASRPGTVPIGIFVLRCPPTSSETSIARQLFSAMCDPAAYGQTSSLPRALANQQPLKAGAVVTLNQPESAPTDMIAHFRQGVRADRRRLPRPRHSPRRSARADPDRGAARVPVFVKSPPRWRRGTHDLYLGEVTAGISSRGTRRWWPHSQEWFDY